MRLDLSAWPEIETYLERCKGVIIPIGSHEQHGPNGLIGTDALCPEIIAREAADGQDDMLVGPTFNIGVAQHHMGFPGSMTLRPSTMIAVMTDWVASLRRHGFTHIYFLNGHGGNIATINAAFAEIYAQTSLNGEASDGTPLKLHLRNWWMLNGVKELCEQLYPKGHGAHATPSEVAVTYYAYPEAVKDVAMKPEIAPTGAFHDAADYRQRFPDGRIGSNPALATPEDGGKIVAAAAKALREEYRRFAETP